MDFSANDITHFHLYTDISVDHILPYKFTFTQLIKKFTLLVVNSLT